MATTNRAGIDLIKRFEGLRLDAYKDPAGIWTIGYGHTGPPAALGAWIGSDEAERLLLADLGAAEAAVSRACPASGNKFAAMVSLAFNIGGAAFATSSVARLHNAGQYARAAQAFALWNKARVDGKLRVLPGLVRRRAAEAELYLTPDNGAASMTVARAEAKPVSSSRSAQGIAATGVVGVVSAAAPFTGIVQDVIAAAPWIAGAFGIALLAAAAWFAWVWWRERNEGRR